MHTNEHKQAWKLEDPKKALKQKIQAQLKDQLNKNPGQKQQSSTPAVKY